MNITIFSVGTQGDVRPFIALGQGLQNKGHKVRIASGKTCEALVRDNGLEFAELSADFLEVMAKDPRALQRGLNPFALMSTARHHLKTMAVDWAAQGLAAAKDADLLLGNGMVAILANSLAEALKIPMVETHLQPVTPCPDIPPMMMPPPKRPRSGTANMLLYTVLRSVTWQMLSPAYGMVRRELGLSALPWYGPYYRIKNKDRRILYAYSPSLLPRSAAWPQGIQVCGNWFFSEAKTWHAPEALQAFLDAGEPPIYIGFGSMLGDDAEALSKIIYEGLRRSGRRAIIATGWGGMAPPKGNADNIHVIQAAPHDWLFPRVAMAVHHGGAGTTAATIRAGIPSVVIPFFGDQPFWAWRLAENGIAPPALNRKALTPEVFAQAIGQASMSSMQDAARAMAGRINAEDGVARAIDLLEDWEFLTPTDESQASPAAIKAMLDPSLAESA